MRPLLLLALAAILAGSVTGGAEAADVKVIANSSVKVSALSVEELKGIFLVTRTSLTDGSHVEPVLLTAIEARRSFVREFMGKSEAALETYYRSLVFTGRGLMPKELASDEEVVRYVAKTKGAVGYVSAGAAVSGVKTIEVTR